MPAPNSTDNVLLPTIQRSLDASGVWVAPELRSQIGADAIETMEEHAASSVTPLFVVVYPFTREDQFGGDPQELLTQLHDASGQDGLYLSARDPQSGTTYLGLTASVWGPGPDQYEVTAPAAAHHPGDPEAALLEATSVVADGTSEQAWSDYLAESEAESDTVTSTGTDPAPPEDGGAGALPLGVLVGVLVALLAVAAVWKVRRAGRRTFTLPSSVIERVRETHDQQLEERAHADVLGLGEAIDEAEMSPGDEQGAWQAALDHYDGAKRVLARDEDGPDVLDVVGAIVLAGRGRGALTSAKAGRPFVPEQVCYLNPLHETARATSTVESGGRRVAVPLCAACRSDLRADRAPDVLDVVRRGRPVHYFDTDAEPWASTGYGALRPDLVARLHGKR